MRRKALLWIALIAAWGSAVGQTTSSTTELQETVVPPAPPVDDRHLIPIDMPANTSLRFGIDPATLTIGQDGEIRYVMVAAGAAAVRNVLYEGLRCSSSEMKTYARQNSAGQWAPNSAPQWRPLQGGTAATAHAMALARQGACSGRTVGAASVAALLKRLRNPKPDPY